MHKNPFMGEKNGKYKKKKHKDCSCDFDYIDDSIGFGVDWTIYDYLLFYSGYAPYNQRLR